MKIQAAHRGAWLVTGVTVLLMGIASCGNGPSNGNVIDQKFTPSHYNDWTSWTDGPCDSWTTTRDSRGNITQTCSHHVQVPVYHHDYIADKWEIKLQNSKHTGWRSVTRTVYGRCTIGAHYPDCANETH